MKKIFSFTSILITMFIVFAFISCAGDKVTLDKLYTKTYNFISVYFDNEGLSSDTCDASDQAISLIKQYYESNLSSYLTEEELNKIETEIGVHNLSRMILNSVCQGYDIKIENLDVELPTKLSQDKNKVNFTFDVKYGDQELTDLNGVLEFNSDLMIDYFYIS